MTNEFNQNEILGKAASDIIQESFKKITNAATGRMKSAWIKISEDFTPFMNECYKRNRYVKILCHKDTDIDLYDVYVNTTFSNSEKSLTDEEIIHKVNDRNNLIINGNGGTGKTFFMRHLWNNLLENSEMTPIFIELRHLNLSSPDLTTFIRSSISSTGNLPEEVFEYFCDHGRFCFVLDGFDEISEQNQSTVERQIVDMATTFHDCSFVISSRFDGRFAGWWGFETYDTDPFTLLQVRELCSKVPFDPKSKALFLRKLESSNFFHKHESFLSNPLLAMMMMMTFRDNMDIPGKMSIFYEQAFNTLFQWHDSTKLYLRDKALDINEFQNSFATFSLLSYYNQVFEFSKSSIIETIEKSNKACGIKQDPELILHDYEKSVNLIKQDGLHYVFVHRSFQEYFSAIALTSLFSKKFKDFLPNILRRHSDNVLSMCYELRSELVIDELISPFYEKHKDQIFPLKFKEEPQFHYLNIIDVEYKFYAEVINHQNGKKAYNISLEIDLDEEINRSLSAIQKLQGTDNHHFDFRHRTLVPSIDISAIDKWLKENKTTSKTTIFKIHFEENQLFASYQTENEDEVEIIKSNPVYSMFLDFALNANISARTTLSNLGKWCKKTVDVRNKQDKSIDEIFDW